MTIKEHELTAVEQAAPVKLPDVWELGRQGHVGARAWAQAHALARMPVQWQQYLERVLLALGALHILAGIVFFFAFNWVDMTSLHKLSLGFAMLVASFIAWWGFGPDSPRGQVAGAATTMMLGVLMALFGQIYQTGADSWELFVGWVALSVPWMLVSRSAAHLLLWSLVALAAVHAYLVQVTMPFYGLHGNWVFFIGGGAMAAILLALYLAGRWADLPRTWWLEGTLQLISIGHFAVGAWMGAIQLGFREAGNGASFVGGLLCLTAFLLLSIYRIGSGFAAVLAFAGIASAITIYLISSTFEFVNDLGFLAFFLSGMVGVVGTAGFVLLVRPLLALVQRRAG